MQSAIQQEIICYLPDKDEPIILPAAMEDEVRRMYIGHPRELKVKIEPYHAPSPQPMKQEAVQEGKIFVPEKKKQGRPRKVAVSQ